MIYDYVIDSGLMFCGFALPIPAAQGPDLGFGCRM